MRHSGKSALATTPRTWPVLVALGLITLLLLATLGVDMLGSRRVAARTAEIVGDTQRSIELVDDLRGQADQLTEVPFDRARVAGASARIAADARAYAPLLNQPGERDEWARLHQQLDELQAATARRDTSALSELKREIGHSVDRLVIINREGAHSQARAIAEVHRQAFIADASVGLLTVMLATVIVFALFRVLRRQRELIADHIALLDERNRDLDAFAGRAAHDLRTPLNPIRGYADLLLGGNEPPDEIRQMASRIRLAVDRMARVIDDMLELSRAGRASTGEASPAAVGAEVLEELMGQLPELRDAQVSTTLTDARVACAPSVLAQIMRNLISNAVKFRSRSRPLELRLVAASTASGIELSVQDNGVGMDEESAAHAFEPYYRGRQDREVPGHGLGLAIVERATRALGGHCEVRSAPDAGTRITLHLPRV